MSKRVGWGTWALVVALGAGGAVTACSGDSDPGGMGASGNGGTDSGGTKPGAGGTKPGGAGTDQGGVAGLSMSGNAGTFTSSGCGPVASAGTANAAEKPSTTPCLTLEELAAFAFEPANLSGGGQGGAENAGGAPGSGGADASSGGSNEGGLAGQGGAEMGGAAGQSGAAPTLDCPGINWRTHPKLPTPWGSSPWSSDTPTSNGDQCCYKLHPTCG